MIERRQAAATSEFGEIRRRLDARRLLAELSHTHGVQPSKYRIVKGRDGGDRIRCGRRNLSVNDFLTKELNLPWRDAAQILRDVYRRQTGQVPAPAVRERPRAALWQRFAAARDATAAAWAVQRTSERNRRAVIRDTFVAARSAVQNNATLAVVERRAARSIARMQRVTREIALRSQIDAERQALPPRVTFDGFLRDQAQAGDHDALAELRRLSRDPHEVRSTDSNRIEPASPDVERNAILYAAPSLTWHVGERGDVTYRHDGRDVVRDERVSVQVLARERDALETGLRLAIARFGPMLTLEGSDAFRLEAAHVAADTGLSVTFTDPALNDAMRARRAVRITERADTVLNRTGATASSIRQSDTHPTSPAPDAGNLAPRHQGPAL